MVEGDIQPIAVTTSSTTNKTTQILWKGFSFVLLVTILVLAVSYLFLQSPPDRFPAPSHFYVAPGMSLDTIVKKAKEEGYVRSSLLLYLVLTKKYDPRNIYAGNYFVDTPMSVQAFAEKLASRDIALEAVTITIPEGTRIRTIAELAATSLIDFDPVHFESIAENKEGYLFPDTYYVPHDFTEEDLLLLLQNTYSEKTDALQEQIAINALSEYEILILASIIEREANDEVSMRTVSGILQNRLSIGMPLQADASIEYILDKPLSELTPEDLEIESPYNTYLNPSLPPTPIGNPGLTAIESVLNPIESDYLFYITGNDGNFYYARSFDEHRQNITRYLR